MCGMHLVRSWRIGESALDLPTVAWTLAEVIPRWLRYVRYVIRIRIGCKVISPNATKISPVDSIAIMLLSITTVYGGVWMRKRYSTCDICVCSAKSETMLTDRAWMCQTDGTNHHFKWQETRTLASRFWFLGKTFSFSFLFLLCYFCYGVNL